MIEPGRARETDLADDLGKKMQRRIGFAPRGSRQFRPGVWRGFAHASPLHAVIGIPGGVKAGQNLARLSYCIRLAAIVGRARVRFSSYLWRKQRPLHLS